MTRKRVPSDFRARFRLDAGPNGAQQERREMRVIGRLRRRIARSLRRLGAADRRRARGRRRDRRGCSASPLDGAAGPSADGTSMPPSARGMVCPISFSIAMMDF